MGYESRCRLTTDGRTFEGTACLEPHALIFRGETRLSIPLEAIEEVHARGESLFVSFDGRRSVLDVGPSAARWAQRIAHPPTRAAKLGIKPGMRIAMTGFDGEGPGLVQEIVNGEAVVVEGTRERDLDAVFVRVRTPDDLDGLAACAARIKSDGAVWVVRTKGAKSAVGEAMSMAAGKRAGLVDVKVVSFSDEASAEKYVIPVARRAPAARSSSRKSRTPGSPPSPDRT